MKMLQITSLLILLFVTIQSSCAPSVQYTLPSDSTRVQGVDVLQQMATSTSDIPTLTSDPVASTHVPGSATSASSVSGLKLADSDTPAAGICGDAQDDPVTIVLGTDSSGMPLAGRCITIDPAHRIRLVNQSGNPLDTNFAGYQINLPVGDEMLLDKPVGQYLALKQKPNYSMA